jgi:hypothetical protein
LTSWRRRALSRCDLGRALADAGGLKTGLFQPVLDPPQVLRISLESLPGFVLVLRDAPFPLPHHPDDGLEENAREDEDEDPDQDKDNDERGVDGEHRAFSRLKK